MIIRSGVTRTVLLAGRWAVKVPSLRGGTGGYRGWLTGLMWSITRGIQANISEAEWWRNSHDPGLCPVRLSLTGLVNVYPRCAPVTEEPPGGYDGILAEWLPAGDKKPDNLGLLDGRLVWVDYDMSTTDCLACRRFGYEQARRAAAGDDRRGATLPA